MNQLAPIGHNNPPSPIDEALAPFGDAISEAETWLDGAPVENEGQMKAVEGLLKEVKAALKSVEAAEESEARPLHDAWKAAKARYQPTIKDLDRMKRGLAAVMDAFKRRLAEERAAEERRARAEAAAKMEAAKRAAEQAAVADIEAQRAAAEAQAEAEEAQRAAAEASKGKVKGLRTVTRHEVVDERAALHWIAANDRPALAGFVADYARRRHRDARIDGVRVWTEKEAF